MDEKSMKNEKNPNDVKSLRKVSQASMKKIEYWIEQGKATNSVHVLHTKSVDGKGKLLNTKAPQEKKTVNEPERKGKPSSTNILKEKKEEKKSVVKGHKEEKLAKKEYKVFPISRPRHSKDTGSSTSKKAEVQQPKKEDTRISETPENKSIEKVQEKPSNKSLLMEDLEKKFVGNIQEKSSYNSLVQEPSENKSGGNIQERLLNNSLLTEVLKRVQKCESDILTREQEVASLKATVVELKDELKHKGNEIRLLKFSHMDLETEAKHTRDLNEKFKEQLDEKLKSLQESTNEMKTQVREIEAEVFKRSFENEAINIRARTQLSTMEADLCKLKTHLQTTDKEIRTTKTNVEENFEKVQRDSVAHIRNIENILCGFNNMAYQLNQSITFQWVLENFKDCYSKGEDVFSPTFYPNVGGYCIQLCVRWSGSRKEYLGVFLYLHRDPRQGNRGGRGGSFHHDYTLAVHDAEGDTETFKVTRGEVTRQNMGDAGGTSQDGCGVSDMLAAPYDKFVVNNSLYVSCTIHF